MSPLFAYPVRSSRAGASPPAVGWLGGSTGEAGQAAPASDVPVASVASVSLGARSRPQAGPL